MNEYRYNLEIHEVMRIAISSGPGAVYWRMRLSKLDKNTYPRLSVTHRVGKKGNVATSNGSYLYANDKKIVVRTVKGVKNIQRHSIIKIRIGDAKDSNSIVVSPAISGDS